MRVCVLCVCVCSVCVYGDTESKAYERGEQEASQLMIVHASGHALGPWFNDLLWLHAEKQVSL